MCARDKNGKPTATFGERGLVMDSPTLLGCALKKTIIILAVTIKNFSQKRKETK